MQSAGFYQIFTKFVETFVLQELFLYRKKTVVETVSVAIVCVVLSCNKYITKSTKAERCTEIMFKLTFYRLYIYYCWRSKFIMTI